MKRIRHSVVPSLRRGRPAAGRPGPACLGIVVLLLGAAPSFGQLPSTQLDWIFPPGGKAGSSLEVATGGVDLDDVQQLIFSHPGITAQVKTQTPEFRKTADPIPGNFQVSIAADVAPGIYEARVVGRFGGSNPRSFVVGRFDELVDDGSNRTFESAREMSVGATANGRADGSAVDYWKVSLNAGQRVLIDCMAERIDSRMDATLVVFDANERELARDRDTLGRDPLIDFTAPAAGAYVIAVHDFLYAGGNNYPYRLTVHTDPHVDFVFPPCGEPGSHGSFTVYGRNLPDGKPAGNLTVNGAPLEMLTVDIPLPGETDVRSQLGFAEIVAPETSLRDGIEYRLGPSNPVRIGFAEAPVVLEQEPNDDPSKVQRISVPCDFAGQFYPASDVDWVEFEARQGEVYRIDVISHRLGLESDPVLLLQKVTRAADGQETVSDVASVDDPGDRNARIGSDFDTSTDDPSYRFVAPQDATYRIMLRDQFGDSREDARYVYRLIIRPEEPDFRLVAIPQSIRPGNPNANQSFAAAASLRRGDTTVIRVVVDRRDGFDGEIEITVEGLPPGVSSPGAVIQGDSDTTWLVLASEENAAPWSGSIRILGHARIGDQQVTRQARGGTTVWGTNNRQQELPAFRATRALLLSVTDKETLPASVQIGQQEPLETSLGGKLEVPVKVTRRGEFKDDMKLVAEGMPNTIKPGDITVKGDTPDGKLEIAITNAQARPGSYTFYLKSDVKIKYARNPEAVARAEQAQTEIDEALNAANQQVQEATAARDQAVKAATEAGAALQKAKQEQADAARIAELETQAKAADEAKAAAEQTLKDRQTVQQRADAAKKAADKQVADLKNANNPKDVTVPVVSTPIRLRILPSPYELGTSTELLTVKQGTTAELGVTLAKRFGFDEKVDVSVEVPGGIAGLGFKAASIEKGQADGKLELNVAANATEGEHTVVLKAKSKFNNVNVEATRSVKVKVEKAG